MIMGIKKWDFFLLIFFLLGGVGCMSRYNVLTPTPLPTLQSRPNFVLEIAPYESQVLLLTIFEANQIDAEPGILSDIWDNITGYKSQICLKIDGIAQIGDDFSEPVTIVNRVTMMVDSLQVERVYAGGVTHEAISVIDIITGQVIMHGVGPTLVCGQVDLSVGVHKVLFQFRQTSGDVLEYEWLFELVDE